MARSKQESLPPVMRCQTNRSRCKQVENFGYFYLLLQQAVKWFETDNDESNNQRFVDHDVLPNAHAH